MSIRITFAALISQNVQKESKKSERLEIFRLSKPMPMKLEAYIDHFLYQFDIDERALSCAYLIMRNFFTEMDVFTVQKLTYTALVISYKAFIDRPAKNSDLEKIGVLKKGELVNLESNLLNLIDWKLNYSEIESILMFLIEATQADVEEDQLELDQGNDEDLIDNETCETCESASELAELFVN
jgi:hypothetical protein